MKILTLTLSMLFSINAFSWNIRLEKTIPLVDSCIENTGTALCNDEILAELAKTNVDARGEFVYFLKEKLAQNENEKFVVNLYEKLKPLVIMYEELDTCNEWSCRDAKVFVGEVATRYVKLTPVNKELYVELYKSQAVQSGRYALLMTLSEKSKALTSNKDIRDMISFAEIAKEYSRSIGDEYYLYQAGVAIIKDLTLKYVNKNPGLEGIYKISFNDNSLNKVLKIDSVVIMESNDRDALVVNFVGSNTRLVRMSFKQSGILGTTVFSNEDVYHNSESYDISLPFFKFELNNETKEINGYLSSARYGKSYFSGRQEYSNASVYALGSSTELSLEKIEGLYNVKVGAKSMKLRIDKRADVRTLYQAALVSENAIITFSKVKLDNERGILSLVDSKNERKLTLTVKELSNGKIKFEGDFINSPLGKSEIVLSL